MARRMPVKGSGVYVPAWVRRFADKALQRIYDRTVIELRITISHHERTIEILEERIANLKEADMGSPD